MALGLLLPRLDARISDDVPFLFAGGPPGARALLSAVTTSMISVTGLVFSITVVALQLASSQFSPRVLRTFLRSRTTQLTLGVFVATFLYAIVVLRSVRGDAVEEPFVPQVSVTVAFVLVLASAAVFLRYIQHITDSIRVSTIAGNVGNETRELIARIASTRGEDEPPAAVRLPPEREVVTSVAPGVLVHVDGDALLRYAERADVVLRLLVRVGDFVPAGAPLVAVHGAVGRVAPARVRSALRLGRDRTMQQDVAFGLRQLVDIAERALSPGVNDPTTAVQVLDQLHDLTRRLATQPDPSPARAGADGTVRLVMPQRGFAELLDLALDEILDYGGESRQVRRRVAAMLDDLESVSRQEHRAPVAAKRRRLC
ncbi:MAG: DUF2254 domain-containing protein [Actinomycetota bacterium]|nr:DUF2254 domain-containing protein [Actinomycetota bacterium]